MRKIKFLLSFLLIFNLTLASVDVSELDSTQMLQVMATTNGDNTIFSVSNAGDINGDGKDDFIIGGSGTSKEFAYLIYGSLTFPSISLDWTDYAFDSSTDGFHPFPLQNIEKKIVAIFRMVFFSHFPLFFLYKYLKLAKYHFRGYFHFS